MSDDQDKAPWLEPAVDEPKGESILERYRMAIIAAGLFVLVAFVVIIWQVYSGGTPPTNGEVPLVKAESGPEKQTPDDPGGMEIRDRDKLVYDRVGGSDAEPSADYLRPGPETPMDRPEADTSASSSPGAGGSVDADTVTPPPPPTQDQAASETESAPAPVAEKAAPAKSVGDYLIQVGAFSERARALKAWKQVQGKYPGILSTLEPEIVTVDRGAKGVLYRLQAGRVADRDSADSICNSLKAKKQPCLVVRR